MSQENPLDSLGLNCRLIHQLHASGQFMNFLNSYHKLLARAFHPDTNEAGGGELCAVVNAAVSKIRKTPESLETWVESMQRETSAKYLAMIEGLSEEVERLKKVETRLKRVEEMSMEDLRSYLTSSEEYVTNAWIFLRGRTHRSYSYPDLLVGVDRGCKLETFDKTLSSLCSQGLFMLSMRQFVDVLLLLESEEAELYDNKGDRLPKHRYNLPQIRNEFLDIRVPQGIEWLDAKFINVDGFYNIAYHVLNSDGTFRMITERLHEDSLMERNTAINMNHWLRHATFQGLPPKNAPTGRLLYWGPTDECVAGYGGVAIGGLSCFANPYNSNVALGVHAAKIK